MDGLGLTSLRQLATLSCIFSPWEVRSWGKAALWGTGGLLSVWLWWQCMGLGHQISEQRVYPPWQCREQEASQGTKETLSCEPSFCGFKKGMDIQVSELRQRKIKTEINTSLAKGEKRAWLFPDGDPLNSDKNQLEVNKIKCCLYEKRETWS